MGMVKPGLDHLEHEEVVAVHQLCINHLTLQIGVALGYQRSCDD
jgi:hypothetical protein